MADWKTRVQPYRATYSLRYSVAMLVMYSAALALNWALDGPVSPWYDGLWVGIWLAWVFQIAVQTLGVWLELRRQQRRVTPDLSKPTLTKD